MSMSVLVSKRTLSRHEYVNTFLKLYELTSDNLSKIAKRKYRWICEPIAHRMNDLYNMIMQSNNDYFEYGMKLISLQDRSRLMIDSMIELQKPLFILWNIEDYETRKMANWTDLINDEIHYLARLGGIPYNSVQRMFILDYEAINKADFLKTMSELHKMIYTKTISLKENIRSTKGTLLMNLADEAWYRVCHANLHMPQNKKMYENRKKDVSIALDCLRQMQQPMAALFNIMNYSENVMLEMATLLDTEMKLLKGLLKSDAKRFDYL